MAKLLAMSPFTGLYRYAKGSVASREDAVGMVGKDEEKIKRLLEKNADVDRVRAAHMNDLENIVPFFILSMLYIATSPEAATAALLFKIFTIARYCHTIAYVGKIRQPFRALAFIAGLIVNVYMTIQIIKLSW